MILTMMIILMISFVLCHFYFDVSKNLRSIQKRINDQNRQTREALEELRQWCEERNISIRDALDNESGRSVKSETKPRPFIKKRNERTSI